MRARAMLTVSQVSKSFAGRVLFDRSRVKKTTCNDTHRLSQYLHKYGLDWGKVRASSRDRSAPSGCHDG